MANRWTRIGYWRTREREIINKEGFVSNDEIDDIQELAFEMGKNGEELEIFEGYEQAEFIFKHYYDLGANERKENFMKVGGFTGLIALGLGGRKFFKNKRFN